MPAPEPSPPTNALAAHFAWTAVFGMNLILPLQLGASVTAGGGQFGMYMGVIAVWALGAVAVERIPPLRIALPVGGLFVALSQVFPVLHVLAGLLGSALVGIFSLGALHLGEQGPASELAGFLVTLFTGAFLMAGAIVLGTPIWALVVGRRPEAPEA